ncbi:hypothetical protein DPMN_005306 [Dreissena polymorpha]|uniref:Uncharacterized protein n=1 Tax=Dreissena polymorpha TaxID=45954 RepID=A0A9D4MSF7_DREPO|nr:hypothetical protein DPMN_005306 [Dreissena polymorpha]
MCSVIKQLKNGKSAGPGIKPEEALKADVETSVEQLYPRCPATYGKTKNQHSEKRDTSSSSIQKVT